MVLVRPAPLIQQAEAEVIVKAESPSSSPLPAAPFFRLNRVTVVSNFPKGTIFLQWLLRF